MKQTKQSYNRTDLNQTKYELAMKVRFVSKSDVRVIPNTSKQTAYLIECRVKVNLGKDYGFVSSLRQGEISTFSFVKINAPLCGSDRTCPPNTVQPVRHAACHYADEAACNLDRSG